MKASREDIIEATLQLAERQGWANTSVREISRAVSYSTIKIYSEFGSKESLLAEVQQKGFRLLRDAYVAAISKMENPEDQLSELCKAHYLFSRKHARYYELMFQTNGVSCKNAAGEVLQHTSEPVRELIRQIAGHVDRTLFFTWWSLIHGFTVIMQGNFSLPEKEALTLLEAMVRNFIKGIR